MARIMTVVDWLEKPHQSYRLFGPAVVNCCQVFDVKKQADKHWFGMSFDRSKVRTAQIPEQI
jgi:hypothetical protein